MYFCSLVTAAAALLSIPSALGAPTAAASTCTAAERKAILDGVPPGFNDVAPGGSAAFVASLPLVDSCTLTLYPNGLPGIEVAPDATTVHDFALLVRQIFYHVQGPPAVDYGNGTTQSDLQITTGVLHSIALPVTFEAVLIFNYNLQTCLIETVVGILTIPTEVLGIPVPPITPALLTLAAEAAAFAANDTTPGL